MSRRKRAKRTGAEFVMESVWDFDKVPDDRLDDCLREFALAIRVRRQTMIMLGAVTDEVKPGAIIGWESGPFRWIDDDARLITMMLLEPKVVPDSAVAGALPEASKEGEK